MTGDQHNQTQSQNLKNNSLPFQLYDAQGRELMVERLIGEGASATVWQGYYTGTVNSSLRQSQTTPARAIEKSRPTGQSYSRDQRISQLIAGANPTPVAIKQLKRLTSLDVNKFHQEAAVLQNLALATSSDSNKDKEPADNIVEFFDFFYYERVAAPASVPLEKEQNWYLVLEYCQGPSLEELHSELSQDVALDYLVQIAEGLNTLHKLGIYHRDLKPGNILIGQGGGISHQPVAKITDFGQSYVPSRLGGLGLHTHGSLWYAAPELLLDPTTADHRADIYSWGVLAYLLLTHKSYLPFSGDREHDRALILGRNYTATYPLPPQFVTGLKKPVAPKLSQIVLKALAFNPPERYQTAAELVEALRTVFLDVGSAGPGQIHTGAVRPAQTAQKPTPKNNRVGSPKYRLIISAIFVVCVLCAAIFWITLPGQKIVSPSEASNTPSSLTPVSSAQSPKTLLDSAGTTPASNNIALLLDNRPMPNAPLLSVAFSPDSHTIVSTGISNGLVNLWQVDSNNKLLLLTNPSAITNTVKLKVFNTGAANDRASWAVYSGDGKRLAIVSGNTTAQKWEIDIWEVDSHGIPLTTEPKWKIPAKSARVAAIGFSYDGKLIALPANPSYAEVVEIETGAVQHSLPTQGLARELVFSKDGSKLVVSTDSGEVNLWRLDTLPLAPVSLITRSSHTPSITFSPDDQMVAFSNNDQITTYNVSTKRFDSFNTNFKKFIFSVVFHPNGQFIAYAGEDGVIGLWDLRNGRQAGAIPVGSIINKLTFSPDGNYLASGDDAGDNSLRLYATSF